MRTESGWGRTRGAGRPATLLAARGEARKRRMERQPTQVGRVKEPQQVGRNVPGRPEPLLVVHKEASRIHPAGPPGTPTHPIARGLASLNPRACPPRPGGLFFLQISSRKGIPARDHQGFLWRKKRPQSGDREPDRRVRLARNNLCFQRLWVSIWENGND